MRVSEKMREDEQQWIIGERKEDDGDERREYGQGGRREKAVD